MSLEAVQLAQALAVREQAVARPSEPEAAAVAAQPSEARAVVGQPSAVPVVAVAQDVPQEAAEVRAEPLAAAAVEEQPWEARAAVVGQPSAVPVVAAAQDVPQEAAEVRDERLAAAEEAAALPSAEQRQAVLPSAEPSVAPSVAPQALSLLAARLVRQRTTLPPRGPEVMRFEWSRSQSLRAGSIEFVSWRPVREKESNNVLE
jgi:hypothetical protein